MDQTSRTHDLCQTLLEQGALGAVSTIQECARFHLGNVETDLRSVVEIDLKYGRFPPSKKTLLEFSTATAKWVAIHITQSVDLMLLFRSSDNGISWYMAGPWTLEGESWVPSKHGYAEGTTVEHLRLTAGVLAVFYRLLKCTNVQTQAVEPPEKLQKARHRRGKLPLLSFKTLVVELPNRRRERVTLGGSHDSPGMHTVRAHFKERATGTFFWQEHLRGNKKRLVLKDYHARFAQQTSTHAN